MKNNDVATVEVLVENLSEEQILLVVNQADRAGITPVSMCRER
jgi:hypothetical protein